MLLVVMSLNRFSEFLCILLLILFVVKTASQNCGQSTYDDSVLPLVIGGNASEGAWPWMAAIRKRESSDTYARYWCSGFLIDKRHVISVAHCFDNDDDVTSNVNQYRVRIGNINEEQADEYRIGKIVIHDGYAKGMFYDDIVVLTLNREVRSRNYNAVCLPDEEVIRIDMTGRGGTIAGWGGDPQSGEHKIYLQQLSKLPIISNKDCHRVFSQTVGIAFERQFPIGINKNFICAGFLDDSKDACATDSGAPLMIRNKNRWYVVGIVSFGFPCKRRGVPGGYTNISNYLEWINENIEEVIKSRGQV